MGAGRPGRERRRGRRRRRHRRRHPHREPQPPVGHRALPGRGHRRRRHPPRHLHHGRPAHRPDGSAALRPARRRPQPVDRRRGGQRHLRLRQLGRRARRSAARSSSTRPTRATRSSTCCASACCPTDRLVLGQATGVGNLAVLLGSTTGRDGIGGVSVLASAGFGDDEADAAKRPERAGRRPVRGEAPDRGVPRAARRRAGRRHPGPRRRRPAPAPPARRPAAAAWAWTSTSPPCPAREPGMEPFEVMTSESQERMLAIVEPDDLDEVLAICARWEVRAARRSGTGHRRRARCASSTAGTARCWPTCRRRRCTRTRRSTTGRCGPATAPAERDPRRRSPRPPTTRRRPARRCWPTPRGCGAVRPPALPQHRRRARRRRHRAAPQAPGHRRRHRAGRWP